MGKSSLALELALIFGASIVSADSRQIYRYMDVGTAKPAISERAAVPHFMLDLVQPDETYSAKRYRDEGQKVLDRIADQSRVPLVVGGTGYYLRALLTSEPYPAVPPDEGQRALRRAEAREYGAGHLHERLRRLDSASAERIHPANVSRVIRALEIVEGLGGPIPPLPAAAERPALTLGLTMPREELRRRADVRVDQQVAAGLVDECRLLLAMGYGVECPALQGFGYRQMMCYLQGGYSLEEAIALYKTATHQYVRRQMTWFRKQPGIVWVESGQGLVARTAKLIEAWLASGAGSS